MELPMSWFTASTSYQHGVRRRPMINTLRLYLWCASPSSQPSPRRRGRPARFACMHRCALSLFLCDVLVSRRQPPGELRPIGFQKGQRVQVHSRRIKHRCLEPPGQLRFRDGRFWSVAMEQERDLMRSTC